MNLPVDANDMKSIMRVSFIKGGSGRSSLYGCRDEGYMSQTRWIQAAHVAAAACALAQQFALSAMTISPIRSCVKTPCRALGANGPADAGCAHPPSHGMKRWRGAEEEAWWYRLRAWNSRRGPVCQPSPGCGGAEGLRVVSVVRWSLWPNGEPCHSPRSAPVTLGKTGRCCATAEH